MNRLADPVDVIEAKNNRLFLPNSLLAADSILLKEAGFSDGAYYDLPYDVAFKNAQEGFTDDRRKLLNRFQSKVDQRHSAFERKVALGVSFGYTSMVLGAAGVAAAAMAAPGVVIAGVAVSGAALIGGTATAIGTLGWVTELLSDRQAEQIADDQAANMAEGLRKIRDTNRAVFDDLVKQATEGHPEEAMRIFNENLEQSFSDAGVQFSDDPEMQAVANADQIEILKDRFDTFAKINEAVDSAQNVAIADLGVRMIKVEAEIKKWKQDVEDNTARIEELSVKVAKVSARVTRLQADVDVNSRNIEQNTKRIDYIAGVVYGNMSPREKRKALKSGLFPNLTGQALKDEFDAIDRDELREDVRKVVGELGHAVQIMNDLGIDGDIVEFTAQVHSVASTGLNVFDAISKGSYLGAASAIIGTFFRKNRPDAAAIRHRQLMERFADIERNQIKIMKMIQRVLQSLQAISNQIQHMHVDLARRLAVNRTETLINRAILRDIIEAPLENSGAFFRSRDEFPHYGFEEGRFRSYTHLRVHFNDHADLFEAGVKVLDGTIRERDINSIFKFQTYARKPSDSDESMRLNKMATAGYRIFERACEHYGINKFTGIAAVNLMPHDVPTLDHIVDNLQDGEQTDNDDPMGDETLRFIDSSMSEVIYTKAVLEASGYILQGHRYFQLFDNMRNLSIVSPEALLNGAGSGYRGYSSLQYMSRIVRANLAQELIRSGNFMMPYIHHVLSQAHWTSEGIIGRDWLNSTDEEIQKIVGRVREVLWYLTLSGPAQVNYAAYLTYHLCEGKDAFQWGRWGFDLVRHLSRSNTLFDQMNQGDWPLLPRQAVWDHGGENSGDYDPNELVLALPKVVDENEQRLVIKETQLQQIQLPNGKNLRKVAMQFPDPIYHLLATLNRIFEELATYEVGFELSENSPELANMRINARLAS